MGGGIENYLTKSEKTLASIVMSSTGKVESTERGEGFFVRDLESKLPDVSPLEEEFGYFTTENEKVTHTEDVMPDESSSQDGDGSGYFADQTTPAGDSPEEEVSPPVEIPTVTPEIVLTPGTDATPVPATTLMPTETPLPTAEAPETYTPTPESEETSASGNAVDSLDELEDLIDAGISLSELGQIAPIYLVSDESVPRDNFQFEILNASGWTVDEYEDYEHFQSNEEGFTVDDWPNNVTTGEVKEELFPGVDGYQFSDLTLGGTIVESIGMVTVTIPGEPEEEYIYFCTEGTDETLSATVLPQSVTGEHVFCVQYSPMEYEIHYEVYANGSDSTVLAQNYVFGEHRAQTTSNKRVSVDVSAPPGYTARVFVGASENFESEKEEIYPSDITGYGENALGKELTYKASETGAEVDTGGGPSVYSASGTYIVGSEEDPITEDQTVRVELDRKDSFVFHPEHWMNTIYSGNGSRIEHPINEAISFSRNGTSNLGQGVTVDWDNGRRDGSYDFTWTFQTTLTYDYGFILDSLAINGTGLKIPIIDYSGIDASDTETTILPTGARVELSVKQIHGTKTSSYTLQIFGASRDIVITGGNLHGALGGQEIVVEDSTGVDIQLYYYDPNGSNGEWKPVVQSQPVLATKDGAGIHYNMGDPKHHYTNVRFKLRDGYEWRYGKPAGNIFFRKNSESNLPWGLDGESGIVKPEESGDDWYYLRLGTGDEYYTNGNAPAVGKLSITAVPACYVVQYLDGKDAPLNTGISFGEEGVAEMPTFTDDNQVDGTWANQNKESLDGNHGRYYGFAEGTGAYSSSALSKLATLHPAIPKDSAIKRPAQFAGWVVTDAQGHPLNKDGQQTDSEGDYQRYSPSEAMDIEEIHKCGTCYDEAEQHYVIYLSALWTDRAPSFTYYVTLNTTEPDGSKRTRIQVDAGTLFDEKDIEAGQKAGVTYHPGDWYVLRKETYFKLEERDSERAQGLNVVYDIDSARAKSLLRTSLLWYRYDTAKNSKKHPNQFMWEPVPNGGEVDVWLVSNLGVLDITKRVTSINQSERDKDFPFTVTFTLPPDDTGTFGKESEYFHQSKDGTYAVPYTVDGIDEEQMLTLHQNTSSTEPMTSYTGTIVLKDGQTASFVLPGGTIYSVAENVDEEDYDIEKINNVGTITAATEPCKASFTNTPVGIDLVKSVKESSPLGSMTEVEFTITVHNRNETTGVTVDVEDLLSEGLTYVRSTPEAVSDSEDGQKISWTGLHLRPQESQSISYAVRTPLVDGRREFANQATALYRVEGQSGQKEKQSNEVTFTVQANYLRIRKIITRGTSEEAFPIQITLQGDDLPTAIRTWKDDGFGTPIQAEEGKSFTIYLKKDESLVLLDIPPGTAYTVSEETEYFHPEILHGEGILDGNTINEVTVNNVAEDAVLYIRKEVKSPKPEEKQREFAFHVSFEGGEVAGPISYTISDTTAKDKEILENGSMESSGMFHLKDGQTASFHLPDSTTYEVTEELEDPHEYLTQLDGKSGSRMATGTLYAGTDPVTHTFTNIPTGITVTKSLALVDERGYEVSDRVTDLIAGSREAVRYFLIVQNRDANRDVIVSVVDRIPNAEGGGERRKLSVQEDSISCNGTNQVRGTLQETEPGEVPGTTAGGIITWKEATIAAGATETFSFLVTTPLVQNLNTYINTAEISYHYEGEEEISQLSNPVALTVQKNWLRLGKILPEAAMGEAGDSEFTFRITLKGDGSTGSYAYVGMAAKGYEGENQVLPESGSLDFADGSAEVKLKEGQAISLYGIPVGTSYTIEEMPSVGYYTRVRKPETGEETPGSVTSGTIMAEENDWRIFVNTPFGVRLSKSQCVLRTKETGDQVTVIPGDVLEYTLTIRNVDKTERGGPVTITDPVPAGLSIQKIEEGGRQEGECVVWKIPVLEPGEEKSVSFSVSVLPSEQARVYENTAFADPEGEAPDVQSNSVIAASQTGSLTITKKVEKSPEKYQDEFTFRVYLTWESDGTALTGGYPLAGTRGEGIISHGDILSLREGESAVISGLPIGTHWSVSEETLEEQDRYGYDSPPDLSGTLTAEYPDGRAEFVNTWYGLYSLTYNGNGNTSGKVPSDRNRYRSGEEVTLAYPEDDFTRTHAVFLGWSQILTVDPVTSQEEEKAAAILTRVEFRHRDEAVYAVWAEDEEGNGVPDYKESTGISPKPSSSPESGLTPGPDSTRIPGSTSEPYPTSDPGTSPLPGTSLQPAPVPDEDGRAPHTSDETGLGFWSAAAMLGSGALAALGILATVHNRRRRVCTPAGEEKKGGKNMS